MGRPLTDNTKPRACGEHLMLWLVLPVTIGSALRVCREKGSVQHDTQPNRRVI
jgi:hypothetical protein